jgi:taurine--2-oxoglutarate transaminase
MHPLGCAAALAAIEEYKKKKLVENAAKMGNILGKKLEELKEDHKSVGDVRGKGLFWGVELVKDIDTKEPFVRRKDKFDPNILKRVSGKAMTRNVYIVNVINTLIIAPPLIVNEREIDEGVQALGEALEVADKEVK